jgi:hypothetical protein
MTYLAAAASLLLTGPAAMASDKGDLSCAQLENSLMPAPEGYAERCLGGAAVTDYSQYREAQGLVPGDTAFYKINFPAPLDVRTAPLPTLTFTTIGANAQPLFAMTYNVSATVLYAMDNTSRQLGTINETTGAFTSIGAINPDPGASFTLLGLAFDPTSGIAYTNMSNAATNNLYRIDVSTAALTLVGAITGVPFGIDLAFDNTGQLYSHDIGADTFIRVDKTTGAPTVVGPTGMNANFAQGMMHDPSDDTIYGCAFVIVPAQQGQLVTFNKTTGLATIVAGPVPQEMECGVKRAGGGPCTAPIFGGITSATNAGTSSCAINLAWNAAIACPTTTVKYNVYRSTAPNTPPSAATLLQSCVTGLTYTDTTPNSGTIYYYKVRAEDNTTASTGPCNGGVTDSNLAERSATARLVTSTTDDVESGGADWDNTGGSGANLWAIVTTQSHSPTHSWFVSDPAIVTDQRLRKVAAVTLPASGGELSFWHMYTTESTFDGHVVEYSLDGGTTWSDILLGQGTVPANPNRFLSNPYNATISVNFQSPLAGRRAWSGTAAFQQVRIDMADFGSRTLTIRFRFASDNSVSATGVWIDDITFASFGTCTTVPAQAVTPFALAVDTAGNGVYQPSETVVVAPTWRNIGAAPIALTGTLTNHTGPAGPTYSIPDGAADYGTIAVAGNGTCSTGGNCYSVANAATTRPITHWDTTADETVIPPAAGTTKTWTLHVGDSFTDVPASSGFYKFIETILHKNVTGGCTATTYCPSLTTTREQMAVFVLVAREPAGFNPPACVAGAEAFTDVPATSPFCKWIEELARRGVVGGCAPGLYCPLSNANRDQMAVFVLRTLDPALNPVACVAGAEMFPDVPASSPFCKWVEELVRRGVVSGCGSGNYCPNDGVTREQMGVFLSVTFGLTLYGL